MAEQSKVVALPGNDRAITPTQQDADIERVVLELRELIDREGLDSLAVVYTTKQRFMQAKYTGILSDLISSLAKAHHQVLNEFCGGT